MGIASSLVKSALKTVKSTGKFAGENATSANVKAAARIAYNRGGADDLAKFLSGSRLGSGAKPSHLIDDAKAGYFNDEIFSGGQVKLPKGTIMGKTSAVPPFPSSKGAPWAQPSGDPRAAVVGAARREELIQKRKAKKPVKGSITRSVKTPIEGPKSKDVSNVDNFFGAGNAPMGYKYESRK
jgi:hypothetical protein